MVNAVVEGQRKVGGCVIVPQCARCGLRDLAEIALSMRAEDHPEYTCGLAQQAYDGAYHFPLLFGIAGGRQTPQMVERDRESRAAGVARHALQ